MCSITHLTQKLIAERARQPAQQQHQQPGPDTAPPPYEAPDSDDDSDFDSDGEDDDGSPSSQRSSSSSPLKLTINAANSIQGSYNLVPTSPTAVADATKFSTILLHAIHSINSAASVSNGTPGSRRTRRRNTVKVDLTINCGVTVIGDRNVVGNVGLRPKAPSLVAGTSATTGLVGGDGAVAGAKRKAEDDDDQQQEAKRIKSEEAEESA